MVYCGTSASKNACPHPVWKPVTPYHIIIITIIIYYMYYIYIYIYIYIYM